MANEKRQRSSNKRVMTSLSTTTGIMMVAVAAATTALHLVPQGTSAFEVRTTNVRSAVAPLRAATPFIDSAASFLPENIRGLVMDGHHHNKETQQQQHSDSDSSTHVEQNSFRPRPPPCPPPLKRRTLYDILGASQSATRAELKKHYVSLVRMCHPDALLVDEEHEKTAEAVLPPPPPGHPHTSRALDFNEIAQAWRLLSDDKARKSYDDSLSSSSPPLPPPQQAHAVSKSKSHGEKKFPWDGLTEELVLMAEGQITQQAWGLLRSDDKARKSYDDESLSSSSSSPPSQPLPPQQAHAVSESKSHHEKKFPWDGLREELVLQIQPQAWGLLSNDKARKSHDESLSSSSLSSSPQSPPPSTPQQAHHAVSSKSRSDDDGHGEENKKQFPWDGLKEDMVHMARIKSNPLRKPWNE